MQLSRLGGQRRRVVHRGQPFVGRRRMALARPHAASAQLEQVLAQIDALNAQDPRTATVDGKQVPYELAYSQWVTEWVQRLEPSPSEECLIVARCGGAHGRAGAGTGMPRPHHAWHSLACSGWWHPGHPHMRAIRSAAGHEHAHRAMRGAGGSGAHPHERACTRAAAHAGASTWNAGPAPVPPTRTAARAT